jgi:hypothetical protein
MGSASIRYAPSVDRVLDACKGHDRQAVRALTFDRDGALIGVLAHDPVLWHEPSLGRIAALCELEADASFDPTATLFSRDCAALVAGHPGQLRAYDVRSGALLWERDCPWWEVFDFDADSIVCVEYQPRVHGAVVVIELRSGVERSRVEIAPRMFTPTATVEREAVRVFSVSSVLADRRSGALARSVRAETPAFSMDPCAHSRLWPQKIAGGELFLAVTHRGEIVQAIQSTTGGRSWLPKRPTTAHALLAERTVIVGARDTIPATLLLLNANTGSELVSLLLPTEQAETIVCAAVGPGETSVALGTSLGRAIVVSLVLDAAR